MGNLVGWLMLGFGVSDKTARAIVMAWLVLTIAALALSTSRCSRNGQPRAPG